MVQTACHPSNDTGTYAGAETVLGHNTRVSRSATVGHRSEARVAAIYARTIATTICADATNASSARTATSASRSLQAARKCEATRGAVGEASSSRCTSESAR